MPCFCRSSSLMARHEDSNNSQADLADLKGARFVMTSETEDGQRLAEGKLKRITQGTGKIKATRKYENPIEFAETHKLWIDCNFSRCSAAMTKRSGPVANDSFQCGDSRGRAGQTTLDQTAGRGRRDLAWAVAGAVDWSKHGLPPAPELEQVASKWKREADQIGRFIENCCTTLPNAQAKARDLYLAYKRWADESGERAEAEKKFAERMQEREFEKERTSRGVIYTGIGLSDEGSDE